MVAPVEDSGPTLVELVGPAGAGKTTLVRALVEGGAREGIDLPRLPYMSALLGSAFQLLPALAMRPGHSRWFSRSELRSAAYLDAWHRMIGSVRGVTLLDQGPVYRLASLKEFGPYLTDSRAFATWWSAALERWARSLDLIVLLDAPDEILLERINGRAQDHLVKGTDERTVERFLARYRTAFDHVVGAMRTLGGPEVISFDTSGIPAAQVAEAVSARLAARGDRRVG